MLYQPIKTGDNDYSAILVKNCAYPFLHKHMDIEILYVMEGEVILRTEGKIVNLQEGQVWVIGSMCNHEILKNDIESKTLVLEFGPVFLGEAVQLISKINLENPVSVENGREIIVLLNEIALELEACNPESNLLVRGNIYKISALLFRIFKDNMRAVQRQKNEIKLQMKVEKILEMVKYRYAEEITIEEAAAVTGYSVSSFCRIFKKAFGMSFHSFLNDVRVQNACYLLQETTCPLYEIAEKVGFHDTKGFCRVFKQKKGMTASAYRSLKVS